MRQIQLFVVTFILRQWVIKGLARANGKSEEPLIVAKLSECDLHHLLCLGHEKAAGLPELLAAATSADCSAHGEAAGRPVTPHHCNQQTLGGSDQSGIGLENNECCVKKDLVLIDQGCIKK